MRRFSTLYLYSFVRGALVEYFATSPAGFQYLEDEDQTSIVITSKDNYYQVKSQPKPRILINRGGYLTGLKSGINNSFSNGPGGFTAPGGGTDSHLIMLQGEMSLILEARNFGTCELLTDVVSHFLSWSGPLICTELGFKNFGSPISVSEPIPLKIEDTNLFQVNVNIPWATEEMFGYGQDGVKIKNIFLKLGSNTKLIDTYSQIMINGAL